MSTFKKEAGRLDLIKNKVVSKTKDIVTGLTGSRAIRLRNARLSNPDEAVPGVGNAFEYAKKQFLDRAAGTKGTFTGIDSTGILGSSVRKVTDPSTGMAREVTGRPDYVYKWKNPTEYERAKANLSRNAKDAVEDIIEEEERVGKVRKQLAKAVAGVGILGYGAKRFFNPTVQDTTSAEYFNKVDELKLDQK